MVDLFQSSGKAGATGRRPSRSVAAGKEGIRPPQVGGRVMQNSVRRRGESLSGSGTASPSSQSQLSSSASAGAGGRSQTRKGRGANPTTSGLSLRSCRCEQARRRRPQLDGAQEISTWDQGGVRRERRLGSDTPHSSERLSLIQGGRRALGRQLTIELCEANSPLTGRPTVLLPGHGVGRPGQVG